MVIAQQMSGAAMYELVGLLSKCGLLIKCSYRVCPNMRLPGLIKLLLQPVPLLLCLPSCFVLLFQAQSTSQLATHTMRS